MSYYTDELRQKTPCNSFSFVLTTPTYVCLHYQKNTLYLCSEFIFHVFEVNKFLIGGVQSCCSFR